MKKSKVFLIVAIALVAVLAVAGVSFAAWNNLKDDSGELSVEIGKRVDLKVTTTPISDPTILVPNGAVKLEGYGYEKTLGSIAFNFKSGDDLVTPSNTEVKMYCEVKSEGEVITGLVVTINGTTVGQSLDNAVAAVAGDVKVSFATDANANDGSLAIKNIKVKIFFVATVTAA